MISASLHLLSFFLLDACVTVWIFILFPVMVVPSTLEAVWSVDRSMGSAWVLTPGLPLIVNSDCDENHGHFFHRGVRMRSSIHTALYSI